MQFKELRRHAFWSGEITKIWGRGMKLTGILILFALLHVGAEGLSQNVTLSVKNAPLEQVFNQIKQQTGISFLWDEPILKQKALVTLDVKDKPVSFVLDIILNNQGLTYNMVQNIVMIKKSAVISQAPDLAVISSVVDIHGKVTDSLGNPLIGASVTVKGTKSGTETDAHGNFILYGVKDNATLIISYTGYSNKLLKLTGSTNVSIVLTKSISPLDEIQVIAYGQISKRLNTGDVFSVKAKDIANQPISNVLMALEGNVPGLEITQATGLPGSGVIVRIRGQNSISGGNDPLFVIDGMPYSSQLLANNASILGTSGYTYIGNTPNGNGNPLSYLNPLDIESVEILKDADATAIYGSRGANGVILITTKKGQAGNTKIDFNLQNGWGQVSKKVDLLNTPQYLEMRHEAINNDGDSLSDPFIYAPDLLFWDTTRYTNWQKKLIGGTSHYADVEGAVSGGNVNTQYLIGGGYHRETTVFPGDFSDVKGSVHFNLTNTSANKKFKVQFTGNYMIDNNQLPFVDLTSVATTTAPDAPPVYKPDGTLNWALDPAYGGATWANPLAYTNQQYINNTKNLISSAMFGYEIIKGLIVSVNFGYNNMQVSETQTTPSSASDPVTIAQLGNSARSATFVNNNISSWLIEPQITYKKEIGKGKLDFLLGSTIQQNDSKGQILDGTGYNSDLQLLDIGSASSLSVRYRQNSVYKYNALFGRLGYNWEDKYLINLTANRDGSSRFGPANEFHGFGAVGLGWIFTNEEFIHKSLSFLSFGKLRGSYGTTGNDQIGDYGYLDLYNSTNNPAPYQGTSGLIINGLANPDLEWEETKKLEVAAELGFVKDRILLTVAYYDNRSSNQLLSYTLPSITGFTGVERNLPATVQNSGFEFVLNTINIKTAKFSWSSAFNLSIPSNKLVSFPGLENTSYKYSYTVGRPITESHLFHTLGADPATGAYLFQDYQGKSTLNPDFSTDEIARVNLAPKFFGGLQNNITYGQFELGFFFQFVSQKGTNFLFNGIAGNFGQNQPIDVLARWKKPGDVTNIQRFNQNFALFQSLANAEASDLVYSNASFIRLKNVSLSWQLPGSWKHDLHISNCRLYVLGQNLFTITNYTGLDPETKGGGTLPPLRIITVGVQVSF